MPTSILFVLLILAHVIWGGGFIVIKLIQGSFTLPQILFGRVVLAALIYAALWHRIPKPRYQNGDWKYLGLLALCEPLLLFTFETLGVSYTTASQAGMIVACAPMAVAVAAFAFYREKISTRCGAGILLAVTGVMVVSIFGAEEGGGANPLLGNFFMLCAVAASTGYAMTVKYLAQRYSFLYLSAIQVFGATLLFLPGALAGPMPNHLGMDALLSMIYLGVGVTFLVYFIINYALTRLKAGHVILFSNLIPISTLILAYFFLDERLTGFQYFGATLVIGGVALAGSPEASHQTKEPAHG